MHHRLLDVLGGDILAICRSEGLAKALPCAVRQPWPPRDQVGKYRVLVDIGVTPVQLARQIEPLIPPQCHTPLLYVSAAERTSREPTGKPDAPSDVRHFEH